MYPRLYMQSFQYAMYNRTNQRITFETRYACGRRCEFTLSRNQFLALNDAIFLIDKENAYGHYPLGQRMWLHYNLFDASLYRETKNDGRIYFIFASFAEYKRFTHRRLLSLVRLKEEKTVVTNARRSLHNERNRGRGGRKSEVVSSINKRPLSNAMSETNRSPAAKRTCREERDAASRTTDDADLSYNDEASAIFPEWHHSNTRRWGDSISSLSSLSKTFSTTDSVQLFQPSNSTDEMET